jgi:hypothetical protein
MKTRNCFLLIASTFLTVLVSGCHSSDPSGPAYVAPPVESYQGYWADDASYPGIVSMAAPTLNRVNFCRGAAIDFSQAHILRITKLGVVQSVYVQPPMIQVWSEQAMNGWTYHYRGDHAIDNRYIHRVGEMTPTGFLQIEGELNPTANNLLAIRLNDPQTFTIDNNSYSLQGPFHRIAAPDFANFEIYVNNCSQGG